MNLKWQLQSFGGEEQLAQQGSRFCDRVLLLVQPPGDLLRTSEDVQKGKRKGSGGKQQQQKSLEILLLSDVFENKHKRKKKQGMKYLLKMKHLKVLLWG